MPFSPASLRRRLKALLSATARAFRGRPAAQKAAAPASGNPGARSAIAGGRLGQPIATPRGRNTVINLSETTNPARYDDPEWLAIHYDLERYSTDKHVFLHTSGHVYRKGWEWTHCIYGLGKLGALQPGARALGVGVGREPVIFYLADRIAEVVATDLYDNAEWSSGGGFEASLARLEQDKAACPPSVDFSKIRFEDQDGTRLTYADNSFDLAWSLSSIEHFGGHSGAQRALQEMGRVVRPGGIVAVATELLLLDDQTHCDFFTRRELIDDLIAPCHALSLVDTIDFDTLPVEYLIDSITIPTGVDRRRRHVVLNDGTMQWTSVLFFLRKNS
jgi:SAM-dependent methyltransferase